MADQADGSIIIDTEINSDGFKAGSAELLAAIKALSTEVKNLGQTLKELFSKPLTPEINTGGAEDKVAALEAKVQELQTSLEELQNTNGSGTPAPETATPQVNIGGVTEKASGLQREIDAVNSSVQKLEPTFQKAMSGSESAMTSFEGKASTLESKIAELQERLDAVGQTQFPTQEYEAICAEAEKAKQKFDALLDRQEKMQALGVNENSAQWKSLQYDMELVSNKYHKLIALKQQYEASGNAFQMGVDTSQYAQMEATLSAANARLQEMQAGTSQSEGIMRRLASAAGRVASFIGRAAASAAGALVSGIRSAASHMAKMLTHSKSMKGQFSGLISSAKKFTLSLLGARGVYALLRKTVSAYMAQNQQLASTLSSCWSGIGNLLGPIITKLINLVAQAVAYVTAFLKLFGVFSKGAQKAISGAGGAAADAAKDLKRQLASFDELNILNDNSSDSGGGGGGGDIGAELPDVELPDWAKLMVEQIKAGDWAAAATTLAEQLNKMVASVDWAGIGQKIGYYLNGALTFIATFIKKFDWKAVGSDLATLLNNVITSVDWGNLGVILTAKLAILMQFLTGFFETFDGKAFGDGIYDFIMGGINAVDWVKCTGDLSKAISGFITAIDFGKIGQALSKGFRTILQSINAAITNFDWDGVGGKVADFINGIDWSGLFSDCVTLIGNAFIGAFNLLNGFVKKINWAGLADEIGGCLESLVTDIDWASFGSSIGQFLSNAITGVLTLIGRLFTEYNWADMIQNLCGSIGTAIGSMIENIDWGGILQTLAVALAGLVTQIPGIITGLLGGIADILASLFEAIGLDGVAGFFKGIGDAMRSVGTWLKENLVDPVVNWVKDLFGIHSPSTVFAEIGGFLIDGLLQGISNAWHAIVDFFTGAFEGLKSLISGAWEGIKSLTSTVWNGIKSTVSSAWEGIKSAASTGWEAVKNGVSSAWNGIKSWTSSTWSNVKSTVSNAWSGIKSAASTGWNAVKSGVSSAWNSVKSTTSSIWNGIKSGLSSAWNGIKSTASSTWNNLKSTISSGWNNIKSTTSSVWNGVKATLSSTWSNIKSTASSTWNSMKTTASSAWNSMKSTASSTWSNIKSSLSSTWNSIKSTASSTWSGIKNAIQNQGWSGVGSNICNGIANGINSGWSWLKNKVSSLASSLLSAAKSALGIHSPSRLFRDEIGLNIGYGVGEGVEASQPSILKSVSGVADAIADEFNAGDYKVGNIVTTSEVDGALSSFSDKISGSFTSLLDRLQAIADNITFAVPAVAGGVVPYKAAAAAASGGGADIGTTIETSNDALASVVTQVVTNATAAIVTAIQNYSGTTVNLDKAAIAEMMVKEINRRTRMVGQSPLVT